MSIFGALFGLSDEQEATQEAYQAWRDENPDNPSDDDFYGDDDANNSDDDDADNSDDDVFSEDEVIEQSRCDQRYQYGSADDDAEAQSSGHWWEDWL